MLRTVIYSVGIALSSHLIFLPMTPALQAAEQRFLDTNRTTPIVEEPGDDEERDAASTDLRSTRHWKNTRCVPANRRKEQSKQYTYIEEGWLNLETGETCRQNRRIVDGVEVLTNEAVYDGRHAKLVYHEQKEVCFIELSPIQSQMERRLYKGELLQRAYVGNPQRSKRFSKTGEGTIAGTRCEIWSGEVPTSTLTSKHRVRAWLDPETDELLRLETNNEYTGVQQTYDLLERNQPIPAEFMKMHVPTGFTQINKQDAAITQKVAWAGFGTGSVRVSLIFSMPDGTILLASSLEGPNAADRVLGMIKRLEAGDPLPASEWCLARVS